MLNNKVALISGAAQGLGLACAQALARADATVILSDCANEKGIAQAEKMREEGLRAEYMSMDVSNQNEVEQTVLKVVEKYGKLDVCVANAGIVKVCDVLDMTEADLDQVLAVNLKGQIFLGQSAARHMLKQKPDADNQRGSIINMSSIQSMVANPDIASYVVSKGGIQQWTKVLALRLAEDGIRVNAIAPGSIATEMFKGLAKEPDKYKRVMARTPMARPGDPAEVGAVAVFLASHMSSYITAETICVDGGRMAQNYPRVVD